MDGPFETKRNEYMMRKLQIAQIVEFMEKCRIFWKESFDRMNCDRIPDKIQKRKNVWKHF
jgi:hypothetical protein